MKFYVLDPAKQEFDAAKLYYEQRKPGLGAEFKAAIRGQLLKIRAHPTAWMRVKPGIRKCLGSKFPYDVIYQVKTQRIIILAFAHKRQNPIRWQDRAL